MNQTIFKIGLTGGIGSGKTTIANLLNQKGLPIYIADREASRIINSDQQVRKQLLTLFGTDLYTPDNILNKKKLATLIFQNKQALQQVNQIVHPRVLADFQQWSRNQNRPAVVFESAILFEAKLNQHFNYIVCVYASQEIRIQRVMQRDHVNAEKVKERIQNQFDSQQIGRDSDFIINTNPGQDINKQVETLLELLSLQLKLK